MWACIVIIVIYSRNPDHLVQQYNTHRHNSFIMESLSVMVIHFFCISLAIMGNKNKHFYTWSKPFHWTKRIRVYSKHHISNATYRRWEPARDFGTSLHIWAEHCCQSLGGCGLRVFGLGITFCAVFWAGKFFDDLASSCFCFCRGKQQLC